MTDDIVEINHLTAADVRMFYPDGLSKSVQGFCVKYRGEVVAISGIMTGKVLIAFSKIKDGVALPKIMIWKTAKKTVKMLNELGYTDFYTVADRNICGSSEFLKRLGFVHVNECANGEVLRWQIR